jgi:RecA/RadA recombinase
MAKKASKSLSAAVSAEIKSKFDLNKFKSSKGLNKNVKFKDQQWIPLSPAFQKVAGVPGIPMGHISLLRGHSDTGKTTALLEAAVSAQNMGILPVFIITEMKWNWEHAAQMGLEVNLIKDDEDNVVDYEGNFIYVDRETLHTIEDVAAFIMDLQNEQKKGNLPYDLAFFWDSIGSIPCQMSVEKLKNNNEWNADGTILICCLPTVGLQKIVE